MSIDFENWATALAEVESSNKPLAWGDSGLACGRFQVHPAFFCHWFPGGELTVDTSWDRAFRLAVRAFFLHYVNALPPVASGPGATAKPETLLAMLFHLGVAGVVNDLQWDSPYQGRFEAAYHRALLHI